MQPIRIVAIPTQVAAAVRSTMRAPGYGFPAHMEAATDAAPCRRCLRLIAPGDTRRILFTYNRFAGVESVPQPGPVYVHAEPCPRYEENAGFPKELRESPRTLEGYARGRRLIAQEYVTNGEFEPAVDRLFSARTLTTSWCTARLRAVSPSASSAQLNRSARPADPRVATPANQSAQARYPGTIRFATGTITKIPHQVGLLRTSAIAIQTMTMNTMLTSGIKNKTIHQIGFFAMFNIRMIFKIGIHANHAFSVFVFVAIV